MRRAARRPSIAEVYRRYQDLLDADGRPKWLPVYDEVVPPGEFQEPQAHPGKCAGPTGGKGCGAYNFCLWCHERQTRANAVKIALAHVGQPNIYRVSIPLDKWGDCPPKRARQVLDPIRRLLRYHGFTRTSLWLHPFRGNPFQGVRPHIEGIISGDDADPDILDPEGPRGIGLVLRRFAGPKHEGKPIVVHVQRLHSNSRKHVHELVQHGLQVGRPSFPVRRIHAGLYHDYRDRLRCRLTDVHERSPWNHIQDQPSPSPDHLTDATGDLLRIYACVAQAWRIHGGRPVVTLGVRPEPQHVALVAEATPWRRAWKLPELQAASRQDVTRQVGA